MPRRVSSGFLTGMTEPSTTPSQLALSDAKIAIIGIGIMGGALARGLAVSGLMQLKNLTLFDSHAAKAAELAASLAQLLTNSQDQDAKVARSIAEALAEADVILIATKPPVVAVLLAEIAPTLRPDQLVISIAAGVRIAKMEALAGDGKPVIRAMPNTPATVLEGATALARGAFATEAHMQLALSMFCAVGKAVEVEEKLMDAVTGLSGSGPAYVFMLIEALMDGGVKAGLSRQTARLLAAQTVYGAAKMVLETNTHPAELKDNVTTPGGTTIQAVAVLERAGLRTALIDAIEAATERSRELS